MASQEHLEILKQGIATWNTWRKQHPEIRPDLSFADLSGADFSGADFSRADLNGAILSRATLSEATLSRATLLLGATLRGQAKIKYPKRMGCDMLGR